MLRRTAGNSLWLLIDQVFRLVVSLIVGLWVARYLGPDQYGLLNYAGAFCAPFGALLLTSINALVVRDLVKEPSKEGAILGTATLLKLAGGGMALLLGGLVAWRASSVNAAMLPLILVSLAGSVFTAGEVSDLWLQARSSARVSAWVRSGAMLVTAVGKLVLVGLSAPLFWFALLGALELALCAAGWAVARARISGKAGRWYWDGEWARRVLGESWPLIIGGVAALVHGYYDQVLLASIRSSEEVGYYAAALRLAVMLGYFPVAISMAVAPEVTQAYYADRNLYARRLRDVYRVLLGIFVFTIIPLLAVPDLVVRWTFGAGFANSAVLLPWVAGRLLFTNIGMARGLHITNEGLFMHSMFTSLCGMGMSLVLNYLLIPIYGAQGCAMSAVISYAFSTLLLDCFDPRARFNLKVLGSAFGICRVPQ